MITSEQTSRSWIAVSWHVTIFPFLSNQFWPGRWLQGFNHVCWLYLPVPGLWHPSPLCQPLRPRPLRAAAEASQQIFALTSLHTLQLSRRKCPARVEKTIHSLSKTYYFPKWNRIFIIIPGSWCRPPLRGPLWAQGCLPHGQSAAAADPAAPWFFLSVQSLIDSLHSDPAVLPQLSPSSSFSWTLYSPV